MRRRAGLAGLLATLLVMRTEPSRATPSRTMRITPRDSLPEAVAAAQDGDTIELQAGTYAGQAAVISQRMLTLRAVDGPALLQADGAHAEGKALLVVRRGRVQIEGLVFRGARVPQGNGAGIRFEGGTLTLRGCRFFDNEMGLLSADAADAELVIEDCEFGEAPQHEGRLHHLLYVGRMRSLEVSGCRFSGGWRGHLLKSRAAHNLIVNNQLVDGDDGQASYQIDLPNGGLAWVVGNVLQQGRRPQNVAMLAFGAEGQAHADSALFVAHNSFVNEAEAPAVFVRHWPERLPAAYGLQLQHNLLLGAGVEGSGGDAAQGNVWRALAELDRSRWPRVDLLDHASPLPALPALPAARGGPALTPSHEPRFPLGRQSLRARHHWRPGAFQD